MSLSRLNRLLIGLVALSFGCMGTGSSAVATGLPVYQGNVHISATRIPDQAQQVGTVEVHKKNFLRLASLDPLAPLIQLPRLRIERLLPELVKQAVSLGGNFIKIDSISTQFKVEERSTASTCADPSSADGMGVCTFDVKGEEGIIQIQGRVFRTGDASP